MRTQKNYIDWKRIYLKGDPFPTTPPTDPREVKWAGMNKLRNQLESILSEALSSGRTQVVLNRGIIGIGKTHAAFYYNSNKNMPKVAGEKVKGEHYLYIRTPKEQEHAVKQFYRQIVEKISITKIRNALIEANLAESDFISKYGELTGSEEFAVALRKLAYSDNEEEIGILKRYFLLSGVTKTELKKLGVARSIDSLIDQSGILAAFLHSLIGISSDTDARNHCRIFLWLDEMEDLVYYLARYHHKFSQLLRDLVDRIPNFFTLFMNFTMARPERETDIDTILGAYLTDRITHIIKFEELGDDEGVEYVRDLLVLHRTEDFNTKNISPLYPFDEKMLREMVGKLALRTPRNINKKCHKILKEAFSDNLFATPGKNWITSSYLEREGL